MDTVSLLQSLYQGNEPADSILIQDSIEQDGRPLLKSWAYQSACQSVVNVFLFESSIAEWSGDIPAGVLERLIFHDCYSDPLGWNKSGFNPQGDSPRPMHAILYDCSVEPYLNEMEESGHSNCVVVFDSLSPILDHHSGATVCRLLHGIGRHCSKVMSLVHADIHKSHVISQLNHVTSTTIVVDASDWDDSGVKSCTCSVQHQKKSGKILREVSTISIQQTITNPTFYPPKVHLLTSDQITTPLQPDPAANLTFDLRLTTKEIQDRASIVLPYTRVGVASSKGDGKIFYHPDEADDFDESDPDDDLDI